MINDQETTNFPCPRCDNSDINSIDHIGGIGSRIYLKCQKCETNYSIPETGLNLKDVWVDDTLDDHQDDPYDSWPGCLLDRIPNTEKKL